jgi:hypothetical protein
MTFPLTPEPTWSILDSSKLKTYGECPRLFFYEYILGWKLDTPAQDLHFGTSWHDAREHQLLNGYGDVPGAFAKFLTRYREMFPETSDYLYHPKTPSAAYAGLVNYAVNHSHDLDDYEVVEIGGKKMTEISGKVPIDDKRVLFYRMDSIMREKQTGMIESWDHKTTSGKWFDNTKWDREYYLSVQNGIYTHCLYCLFPIDKVRGVKFCKTGFEYLSRGSANRPAGSYAKTRNIEAYKTPEQMNVWWYNTIARLDDIERDMDRLHHCNEEDTIMQAFEMRESACNNYHGCPFHDFCLSWANPLQHSYQPEIGFKVEFWDPSHQQTTNKMDLVQNMVV